MSTQTHEKFHFILKLKGGDSPSSADAISKKVTAALPESVRAGAAIERVFPRASTGERARLMQVTVAKKDVGSESALLDGLRDQAWVEYVEVPKLRKPL